MEEIGCACPLEVSVAAFTRTFPSLSLSLTLFPTRVVILVLRGVEVREFAGARSRQGHTISEKREERRKAPAEREGAQGGGGADITEAAV